MADYPPDLFAIPDTPQETYWVKQCLRWLAERTVNLEQRVTTVPSVATLQQQLTSIADRVGVLERAGASGASPLAVGCWAKTASTAGVGDYDWDTEVVGDSIFSRQSADTQIRVGQAGRYAVVMQLTAQEAGGAVGVRGYHSATVVAFAVSNAMGAGELVTHPLVYAISASAGDYVKAELQTGTTRTGSASRPSQLIVVKVT